MAKKISKNADKKLKKKFYVTTAIDYVNARPHCGHAFEKVLADAISRWAKLLGKDVFFLTGVDENAQKNVEAAQKAGIPVREFVDRNTGFFIELCKKLNLSNDNFIRTTAKEHGIIVQKIVKRIIDKGDIYKGKYSGLYCVGCEAYYTEKDLVEGKCPEHNKEPELRKEDAYFFKLSKYKNKLLKIIPKYVIPESRKNEVLSRVKDELTDICISRKGAKWGIDFPKDKDFKLWVWIDALINYYSGASGNWPADVHVIGKGINWFHSVIWPAILMSADIELPKKLLVHGYLNLGGEKISKSLGNVIDPIELVEKYGADSVRYSLLKCSVFDDSDYSEEILINRNNNELADKLGNLVSRVSALAERYGLEKTKENKLLKKLKQKEIEKEFENFEIDKALNEIFAFIDTCNEYVQSRKPWETHDKKVLYELVDSIKAIAILLWPFIPSTSEKIAKHFWFEIKFENINKELNYGKIRKSEVLFKKIEVKEELKKEEKKQDGKEENINKDKINVANMSEIVKYEEFSRLDLRVGTIEKIEDVEGADKLLKLIVDTGDGKGRERTIVAGIKKYYKKEELKGKQIIVICNLEPRVMKGIKSEGMLLAASNKDESKVILLSPEKKIDSGSKVK
jgi:methionyl-tRNA synthetase